MDCLTNVVVALICLDVDIRCLDCSSDSVVASTLDGVFVADVVYCLKVMDDSSLESRWYGCSRH